MTARSLPPLAALLLSACSPAASRTQGAAALPPAGSISDGSPPPPRLSPAADDRIEIAALVARFADAANRHDWQTMAELHTEDAVWEGAAGELSFRNQGRADILAWLRGNEPKLEVVYYFCSAPHIEELSEDHARSRASMFELLRIRATGELKHIYGVYSDELVKRDGSWRFARRSVSVRHQHSAATPPPQAQAQR